MTFFYDFGEMLIPFKFRVKLRSYVKKTGKGRLHYELYAVLFLLSLIISFAVLFFFLMPKFGVLGFFLFPLIFIGLLIATSVFIWMYYEILMFKRKEKIEEVLPDFLENVSVNLRAGMTFYKALWNSVEPEYDVLAKEIEIVSKKVMTGEDTEQALKEFADKYDSNLLKESIDLIIVGLRSGGEISDLIDRVVDNVKEASFLKKELIANVMSYVIFISLISLIIAPSLFALSYNLMLIMKDLGAKLASSGGGGGGDVLSGIGSFGAGFIKDSDFINFSRWCIIIISISSSVIIADLREGSIKGSVKYVFFFIGISMVVYFITLKIFTAIFGGMVS
ncbi:hypothetical protein GF327_05945 [Candidatus Woesearchaeota archaeon]|nr:hypothetical protein [Candidatus Woesearchaeota archaeon]